MVDSRRVGVRRSPDRAMTLAQLARAVQFRSGELRGIEPSLGQVGDSA